MRAEDRFWSKVDRTGDCWEWTASGKLAGYGHIRVNGRLWLAHRYSWTLAGRELTEGLVLDHICDNKKCVNPDHLQQVTHRENILRGTSPSASNSTRTHCIRGHVFDESNTYVNPRGKRLCRTCKKARYVPKPRILSPTCGRGHQFSEENTYWSPGGLRQCRECRRERRQQQRTVRLQA